MLLLFAFGHTTTLATVHNMNSSARRCREAPAPNFNKISEKISIKNSVLWSEHFSTFGILTQLVPPIGLFLQGSFMSDMRWIMETKVKYEERIDQIEKGSFCPLIFSTSGGVGPLCDNVHKKLTGRIAIKRKENYGDVIRFIRTRLRFAL